MTTAQQTLDSDGSAAGGPWDPVAAEFQRWLASAAMGLLWCTAALVGWRRLDGALQRPLSPAALLLLGVVTAAAAVAIRSLQNRQPARLETSRLTWIVRLLLPSLAVLLLGAAVSLPGTNAGGLIAFWALLAGEEFWAWRPAAWRIPLRRPGASHAEPTPPPVRPAPLQDPAPWEFPHTVPADDVLQQLTRSQAADGIEQLAGWLRPPFAAGQRTASVHVAFCPPFAKTPHVSVEQLDGPSARIKTAQLLPHGVRLELKLAAAAETSQAVLLQFAARSKQEA